VTADRPSVFLSHSSAGNPAVAYVRNRLYRSFVKRTKLEVLLDVELLRAGDVWRPILHRWLGECDSAILLLSEEALASEWVRTEATILTWRRSLGSPLTVVPVRIGTTRKAIATPAFTPLDLGNVQFEALGFGGDLDAVDLSDAGERAVLDAAVDALVKRLLDRLKGIAVDSENLPMRRWLRKVTNVLSKLPHDSIIDAATELGMSGLERANEADRCAIVAHRLLTASLDEVYRTLTALEPRRLSESDYRYLVDLVVPVWVPALAGRNLLDASAPGAGTRTVAINGQYDETGLHYLARATCADVVEGQVVTVNDVTGMAPEEELLVRYQQALWRESGLSAEFEAEDVDAEQLASYLAEDVRQQFVLIGCHAAASALEGGRESVLSRLADCHQKVIFIVLAGGALWNDLAGSGVSCVTPELAEGDESKAKRMLLRIDKLWPVPRGAVHGR
jgi:hypothetical protein